jgi:hypothetical protein
MARQLTYHGTVQYTVDTSSIDSIGLYFWLQSLDPLVHPEEKEACEKIAELCRLQGFREHISIREYWHKLLLSKLTPEDEITRWTYEEAFKLLSNAR